MMTLTTDQQLFVAATLTCGVMLLLWIVQIVRRDAGVVDVGWSFSVGFCAILFAVTTDGDLFRRMIVGALGGVWAFRLGTYLLVNRVWGKSEDGRYQALRRRLGRWAHVGFLGVFQGQAVLAVVFAWSMFASMSGARPFGNITDVLGVLVWFVAIVGEAIADAQLARFRATPANKGHVCQVGLWRYSRHPNYFFEWLHWWAYPLLAFGAGWWGLTFLPPMLMLFFLFKVTGIPYTEKQAVQSRGEAYRRYQRTTSMFIPWPPKKELV